MSYNMTFFLNNLISLFITQTEYVLGNLVILVSLILEELIIILTTPTGFIAIISLIIFFECLITESIIEDIKSISFKQNSINIPSCNIPPLSTATLYKA